MNIQVVHCTVIRYQRLESSPHKCNVVLFINLFVHDTGLCTGHTDHATRDATYLCYQQCFAITSPKVCVSPTQIDVNNVQSKRLKTETTSFASEIRPILSLCQQFTEQVNPFHAHTNYVLLMIKQRALMSRLHHLQARQGCM